MHAKVRPVGVVLFSAPQELIGNARILQAAFGCGLTSKLTGPEQRDGICASVFACTNAGTLCRVRLSDLLGLTEVLCDDFAVKFTIGCC